MQPGAAVEPRGVELVRLQLDRDAAVGRHRAPRRPARRARPRARRAGHDRAGELDPPLSSSVRASVRPRRGLLRYATRLRAELGHPRRHIRRLTAGGSRVSTGLSAPGASGWAVRTTTSRSTSPRVQDHGGNLQSWHGQGITVGPAALVSDRRAARRLRGARRRAPQAPPSTADSAGARGLRGRALLPRNPRARAGFLPPPSLSSSKRRTSMNPMVRSVISDGRTGGARVS